MNKNDQIFIAQKIRSQYTEKEYTELDELSALNKKIKLPVNIFVYTLGTVGTLILGTGMSLVTEFSDRFMSLGIITGVIGIAVVAVNYPIYKKLLSSRKKKYAAKIIELSDKIINWNCPKNLVINTDSDKSSE